VWAAPPAGYVYTPHGLKRAECVHTVPDGGAIFTATTHSDIMNADGTLHRRVGLCGRSTSGADDDDLPPDYDGWLEYAAFEYTSGFETFLGNFTVPDIPAAVPDVLYLFTGLQNIDWIPKVDHEPTDPFDIIQPVLQYPGDSGNYWSVRSWYVTLTGDSYASPEVRVDPGDSIFGNMTRTGVESYFINSVAVSSQKATGFTANHPTLTSQPWSYVTLECYGCSSCSTYPKQPVTFSRLALTGVGNQPVQANWQPNPKPAKDRKCAEAIKVMSPTDVVISFQ